MIFGLRFVGLSLSDLLVAHVDSVDKVIEVMQVENAPKLRARVHRADY